MSKLKLKRKSRESPEFIAGKKKFQYFMTMNKGRMLNEMTEEEKEYYIFMAGFYAGINYKEKGE